jgi:hypothetical protein
MPLYLVADFTTALASDRRPAEPRRARSPAFLEVQAGDDEREVQHADDARHHDHHLGDGLVEGQEGTALVSSVTKRQNWVLAPSSDW